MNIKKVITFSLVNIFCTLPALGFEDTNVLPKGVRGLNIRTINTAGASITDRDGVPVSVAKPLNKPVTFAEIIKNEHTTRRAQVSGLLLQEGFDQSESVGDFHADIAANVTVVAPIMAYGVTDNLTLAVAVPYFQANVTTAFGFTPNEKAQAFLATLVKPEYNQLPDAQLAGEKLNNVHRELNTTLRKWGYENLDDWSGSGVGDITLAAKHRAIDGEIFKLASLGGVTLPTGKVDDPDVLNDIPFGYGTYDLFAGLVLEQKFGKYFTIAQHGKYTYRIPSKGEFRMQTREDEFEVEKEELQFKLGDKVEGGVSASVESSQGFLAGIGYIGFHKLGDDYKTDVRAVETELERATDQSYQQLEVRIGYSSIEAYKAQKAVAPFVTTLELKRFAKSTNTPNGNFITLDMSLFF